MKIKIITTEHYEMELCHLLAFHTFRSKCEFLPEDIRKFHRKQAEILRKKIFDKKNAPWNWEKFLEVYKGK